MASTSDEVIELINWYRARWDIEIFFHVLKNACKVEAMQLSHIDNIERALALFMVVAWRIAYLMSLGRICLEFCVRGDAYSGQRDRSFRPIVTAAHSMLLRG